MNDFLDSTRSVISSLGRNKVTVLLLLLIPLAILALLKPFLNTGTYTLGIVNLDAGTKVNNVTQKVSTTLVQALKQPSANNTNVMWVSVKDNNRRNKKY